MLKITRLSKSYRGRAVLEQISHTFPSGTVSAVVAPNGTGKTTLFKCVLGLERHRGDVTFDGEPLSSVRDRVAVLWDEPPFYPHLTGRQNLQVLLGLSPPLDESLDAWPGLRGVPDRPVRTYSQGQRKQLGMVAVSISGAHYVVIDEVSNGLDADASRRVVEALRRLRRTATVIVSGHNFHFLAQVADRVSVLTPTSLEEVNIGDHLTADTIQAEYDHAFGARC